MHQVNVSGCLFSYLWGSNRCIKSRAPQSLSVTVNSSNLLCKLLWFFFIYRHAWKVMCSEQLIWSCGMKWFADSFIIQLHFFFSVDLWSRSRFPIYYQHHQFQKEISVRLIYFHINYCLNILNLNDISPFKTNSFSFL